MVVRLVLGLVLTLVAAAIAGRRLLELYRIARLGQPVGGRVADPRASVQAEAVEVFGQRKLLKWSVPGAAHFFTFWGFLVLSLTILEAYGALVWRDFHIPLIGTWPVLGFLEDFFAVAVLVALVVFTIIRVRANPATEGRRSRFFGSHTGAAWLVLFMIFNVIWTLLLYRGAQINTGYFPYKSGAFASQWVADLLHWAARAARPSRRSASSRRSAWCSASSCWSSTPSTCTSSWPRSTSSSPAAPTRSARCCRCTPAPRRSTSRTRATTTSSVGVGKVEDFTWKGILDFATCTECGRCQSQCPAWNTGKPLSPKLVIMGLRDHTFAKAPWLLAGGEAPTRPRWPRCRTPQGRGGPARWSARASSTTTGWRSAAA